MIFTFPLLECFISVARFFLRYFALHLVQKNSKIAKSTKTFSEFRTTLKALFHRDQNQLGKAVVLERTLSKYFGRHFEVFQKFNDAFITFMSSLFD